MSGVKVSEVAKLTGVSVRTLHYYDGIGLLKPASVAENGYRFYSDGNLQQLQQILFFRELDFNLQEIKQFLTDPNFNAIEALEVHRRTLMKKQDRLIKLVQTIDQTILDEKGALKMTNEERFAGFNFDDEKYEQEAREKWGDEAVDNTNEKLKNNADMQDRMNERFRALAEIRHMEPSSDEAQAEIARWFDDLNQIGNYSLAAFQGLGETYVGDERFKENIDQFGTGLAEFMCEAMKVFAENQSEE